MASQLEWDKFETALLIDASEQVIKKPSAKKDIVKALSYSLRERARHRGIQIDNAFRNVNGISLQMRKVIYLLSDGKLGLPGASKIFVEMVAVKKDNPSKYYKILKEAQKQVRIGKRKKPKSIRDAFIQWLDNIPNKKFHTEVILNAMEEGSQYSMARGFCDKSFWEMSDAISFSSVAAMLQDIKIFRFTRKSIIPALDNGIELYRSFLRQNQNTISLILAGSKNNTNESVSPVITPQEKRISSTRNHDTENKENTNTVSLPSTPVNRTTLDENQTSSDLEDKNTLEDRIYIALKAECKKNPYGATLAFIAGQVKASEKEVRSILSQVEWAILKYGKYTISESNSSQYQTYDFHSNLSLTFTRPIKALYFDEIVSQASSWKQLYLDLLKVLYDDYPHVFHGIIGKVFPRFSSPLIGNETHFTEYRRPGEFAPELYVETNMSAYHTVGNLKIILDLCNVDYENIKIIYERKSTESLNGNNKSASQVRLYQKLYAISKTHNDPNGISVSRILQMITFDVSYAAVEDMLDRVSWATKLSDGVYSFARTTVPKTQPKQQPKTQPKPTAILPINERISESAFYRYLRDDAKMAESTCRGYVSAIHSVDSFAKKKHYINQSLLNSTPQQIILAIDQLEKDSEFAEYNKKQHNRFSAALAKLSSFVTQGGKRKPSASPQANTKVKEENVCPSDFDKDKYIAVLMARYSSGMKFDSIDFENFRDMYFDMYDKVIAFDDDELKKRLMFCGVYYKDRLFPADGIIDKNTSKKLFQYIEKTFASGKPVIYYKAIMTDMADDFIYCFNLSGEDMLRAYLEYTAPEETYYFHKDYISTEKEIEVDHTTEIISYILSVGKPLKLDEMCAGLPHVSDDVVKDEVRSNNDFFWDAKGYYFHMSGFEASESELEQIALYIADEIEKEGYALWPRIYDIIVEEMPIFLENNAYLSSLGIRNAVARKLSQRYSFESAIISPKSAPLDTSGVFRMYAKHHDTFTAEEIYQFAREFGSVIYYDALAEESIRVNKDIFVSKDMIYFDVDAIDYALSTYFSGEYVLMKDMDSFLAFPGIGYPWNQFVLESFIHGYSRKYMLINNGYSRSIVPGAIVKKDSHLKEFVDVVAAVIADSDIELKESTALSFLADNNLIVNKRYGDIRLALDKARRIRNRKG